MSDEKEAIAGEMGEPPLRDALFQAEKMHAMSTLAPGFIHDAGTPLMAISSLSQFLGEKSGDPQVKENLRQIGRSVDQLTQILRTIADFSRPIRTGQETVYLNSLIMEAVRIVKHDRRLKYREVGTELEAAIPQVSANPDQLLQVIISLCLNAADALETVPAGTLTLKSWQEGDKVHLAVKDSGTGIPLADQSALFAPWFTTKGSRGSGLGLFLSRSIITAHGGTIGIVSDPGKGTCVEIVLPALAAERGA